MATQVEELSDNRVRLTVEVPQADLQHALEHAFSDLARSVKVPGFRKGKVPTQVLEARIGKERIFSEAVESHIGGWFLNAAASTRIRPVAAPEYDYDLPESDDQQFSFTATVSVQPKPEPADWTKLEVGYAEPEIPAEVVDGELEELRSSVAELAPVEDRPARTGDVVVIDVLNPDGEGQRDLVVELGAGRLVEELERALIGTSPGEAKEVDLPQPDGSSIAASIALKELKEKVLPPLDDELARAASEFDTLEELRGDIEQRIRDVLEEEAETAFRADAVDSLVRESGVEAAGPLVEARTRELLNALVRSLERRGISADAYLQLTGQTGDQLVEQIRTEAQLSVGRELVLEAVADKLELDVDDAEIEELIREQAETHGDDADEAIARVFESDGVETLRADLRLRKALDRVAAEAQRVPAEVARARESIWTPDKESQPTETKLWTPGSKEPA
ncbi:MAG TPA: trigger factor [Gaiellaceae bacterium]